MLKNLTLNERSVLSSHVLEAKVINSTTILDKNDGHIYTIYQIEDQETKDKNYLSIRGGQFGKLIEIVNPSLILEIGIEGIFFLKESNQKFKKQPVLMPAAGLLSFLAIDKENHSYSDPLNFYENRKTIYAKIGKPLNLKLELPLPNPTLFPNKSLFTPPIVTSITPSIVTAGTETVITINGNNFGSSASGLALLEFRNPDITGSVIGYQSTTPAHILSWNNTQIQAIVPGRDPFLGKSGAGTGSVRVRNTDGEAVKSDPQITVLYNRFTEGTDGILLINDNGFGGYTFTYHQSFFNNTPAVEALERALETWQCTIQTSFVTDGSTTNTNCPANDGLNLISFDNNCQLSPDLLAQTTHWLIACPNGDAIFLEMDMIFDSGTNWNFSTGSPATNQYDFESLALHEFGHAHGIGHVRDGSSIMFPVLFPGITKRFVDANSEDCGDEIVTQSSNLINCGGNDPFIPLPDCNLPCDLTLSAIQSSNCLANEMVEYTLTILDINGGNNGFNILIDGNITPGSPYNYSVFGTTSITVMVLADGNNHTITVEDVITNICLDEVTILPPDCFCALDLTLSQIGNCDENMEVLYTLNVIDNNGSTNGFNVFINGNLTADSPHNYSGTGSTFINLSLPGNGLEQVIEVEDFDDVTCMDSILQITPDCQCSLSLESFQTGVCDDNDEVLYTLTIQDTNGSTEGFDLFIDGLPSSSNPHSYSSFGTTILDVLISGDGTEHDFLIMDLFDNACVATDTIISPDCNCSLNFSASTLGSCNPNGTVTYSLEITTINQNNTGFNIYIDGQIYAGSPILYDPSGTTIIDIEIQGDGNLHDILVEDADDIDCNDSQSITSQDCACELSFSAEQIGNCNPNDSLDFKLNIVSINGSPLGFNVFVDNQILTGSPFLYHVSGITELSIQIVGDGLEHEIKIEDEQDLTCTAIQSITSQDCICELSFSAEQIGDCNPNDSLDFNLNIVSTNGSLLGFNVFVDNQILNGSPFPYHVSGITELPLQIVGDGLEHEIKIEDAEDLTCTAIQSITSQDCACELSFTAEQISDCNSNDSIEFKLTILSFNGSPQGFNVFVDNQILINDSFLYHSSDTTELHIQIFGDGLEHEISIVDAEDSECVFNQSVSTQNCACDLSFLVEQSSDCNPNDSIDYNLTIFSLNGSSQGFNVFIDNLILNGSPFLYHNSDTTELSIQILGSGLEHEIKIEDVEDLACFSIQSILPSDCICELDFFIEQSSDCINGNVNFTLTINSENGSEDGFNMWLDDALLSGSPFAYHPSGITTLELPFAGDGMNHILELQDANDIFCGAITNFSAPECICILTLEANQINGCGAGAIINYELNILSQNSSIAGFQIWIDNILLSGSPFPYALNDSTQINFSLNGDGLLHNILVEDVLNPDCQNNIDVTPPDCSCTLSILSTDIGACDIVTDEVPVEIFIENFNGSTAGFQLWVDGTLHDDSPFSYDANGITSVTLLLPGDAQTHSIEIQDMDNVNCSTFGQITTVDCLCQMTLEVLSLTDCNDDGELLVALNITNNNTGMDGFNVLINDEIHPDSPFDFSPTGLTNVETFLTADGSSYSIEIQDISDNSCSVSASYDTPDCTCILNLNASLSGDCLPDETISYTLTIDEENGSSFGFNLYLDNELVIGSPFPYEASGTTTLEINISGDSDLHMVQIIDAYQANCMATIEILTPDCICELDMVVNQIAACDNNDSVLFAVIIKVANHNENGFNLLIDNILHSGSPFDFQAGGTTILELNLPGDGTTHNLLISDVLNPDCFFETMVNVPECTCILSFTATQISDCQEDRNSTWSLAIEDENGDASGFHIFLDGENVNPTGFPYTSPLTFINLEIPGDGNEHQIEIQDLSDENCSAQNTIMAPDCACHLWLEVAPISGCNETGMIEVLGSLTHELVFSDSFQVLIDGVPFSNQLFEYEGNSFSNFQLSLQGDGASHFIEVQDSSEPNCEASFSLDLVDCTDIELTCDLSFSDFQIMDCEQGEFGLTFQFEGPQDPQRQFSLYQNGIIHEQSPFNYHVSGLNTLHLEAECDTLSLQLIDLQMEECQIDTIIIPTLPIGHFNLYPNPLFYQNFELSIEGIDAEDHDKLLSTTIFDVLGREVFSTRLLGKPFMRLDLTQENFAAGLYYFVMGAKGKYQAKILFFD